jgi:uncharacterized membrane protein
MPFCAKCGTSVSDGVAFCGSCGAPVGSAASGAPVANATPVSGPQASGLTSNVAGALSYLAGFITGIIFLAIDPWKNDSFVRFHAFQSIFLSVAYIAFSIVWGIIFGALFVASLGFLTSMIVLISSLIRLAFLLLWLFMMYKAYNNERYLLPIIGPMAAQRAGL